MNLAAVAAAIERDMEIEIELRRTHAKLLDQMAQYAVEGTGYRRTAPSRYGRNS